MGARPRELLIGRWAADDWSRCCGGAVTRGNIATKPPSMRTADAVPTFDQERFEELVLWIAHETKDDKNFGRTKLAKVLFYCDFDAYRDGGAALTGATYERWKYGPFPPALAAIEKRLEALGKVRLDYDVPFGEEKKIVPLGPPPQAPPFLAGWQIAAMRVYIGEFSDQQTSYVSDASHKHPGWRMARELQSIPYAAAFLASGPPRTDQVERAKQIAREQGWLTSDGWIWERESA